LNVVTDTVSKNALNRFAAGLAKVIGKLEESVREKAGTHEAETNIQPAEADSMEVVKEQNINEGEN
jgi:hypothetical protein